MAAPLVQACDSADLTPAGECLHAYWVAQPHFLPPLSIEDGVVIGTAIVAAWAVGFGIRCMRRVLS